MTKDEARIFILEQALIQSYHTISFMHGCLTSDGYKYAYPDQTIDRLNAIEKLVDITYGCPHSARKMDCDECRKAIERNRKFHEAQEVLSNPVNNPDSLAG